MPPSAEQLDGAAVNDLVAAWLREANASGDSPDSGWLPTSWPDPQSHSPPFSTPPAPAGPVHPNISGQAVPEDLYAATGVIDPNMNLYNMFMQGASAPTWASFNPHLVTGADMWAGESLLQDGYVSPLPLFCRGRCAHDRPGSRGIRSSRVTQGMGHKPRPSEYCMNMNADRLPSAADRCIL